MFPSESVPEPEFAAPTRVQLKVVSHDDVDSQPDLAAKGKPKPRENGNMLAVTPSDAETENRDPVEWKWTEELQQELNARNSEFESSDPETIIQWAHSRFGKKLTFATAFGPEGMVILHLISKLGLNIHCFNLDTGYQFAETLRLRDQVASQLGIAVEMSQPDQTVEEFEQQHGKLYLTDPNRCCHERKIKVLHRVIAGKQGWISAIRRDQSPDRALAPIVGWDPKFNLVKVNPLANMTKSTIWKTILDHEIPYNPLHDQGYPSIGCEPCTRPVQIGEDERAGRWSGSAKTECGLHSR